MAMYLIGDIQGCDSALGRLLETIDFSPSRDTLFILGDLVNRGPASAAVLQRLRGYGNAARCLLGNHDLHLLSVAYGVRAVHRNDTLDDILHTAQGPALLDWLRHQQLAHLEMLGNKQLLMVHAGVVPSWNASKTIALANEVESLLQSSDPAPWLRGMYGPGPDAWDDALQGRDRVRVIVNALTRLRFCTADGTMEFASKDSAAGAPQGFMPWFDAPQRQTQDITVAFGHWSTLGWLGRESVISMDTGCVWGGCLSALRIAAPTGATEGIQRELIQVKCPQAQVPGA